MSSGAPPGRPAPTSTYGPWRSTQRRMSAYDPNAVSPAGAVGLMQLMPATAARYGVADSTDPSENIAGGATYLRDLQAHFGNDLRLVLAAYNAGEEAVERTNARSLRTRRRGPTSGGWSSSCGVEAGW